MSRFHLHRWGPWLSEFEECPDDDMGVWEIRTRECRSRHCDYFEELTRMVSETPAVLRLGRYYGEVL
jgi:hypothetical protein